MLPYKYIRKFKFDENIKEGNVQRVHRLIVSYFQTCSIFPATNVRFASSFPMMSSSSYIIFYEFFSETLTC